MLHKLRQRRLRSRLRKKQGGGCHLKRRAGPLLQMNFWESQLYRDNF